MERAHERFHEFVREFWDEKIPWDDVRWTDPRILALLIVRGTQTLEACPHIDPSIERDLRGHLFLWMRELPRDESACDTVTIRDRLAAHAVRPDVRQTLRDEDASNRFSQRVGAFENIGNAFVLHRSPADATVVLQQALRNADGVLDASEVQGLITPLVELMGIAAAIVAFSKGREDIRQNLRAAGDIGSSLRLARAVFFY